MTIHNVGQECKHRVVILSPKLLRCVLCKCEIPNTRLNRQRFNGSEPTVPVYDWLIKVWDNIIDAVLECSTLAEVARRITELPYCCWIEIDDAEKELRAMLGVYLEDLEKWEPDPTEHDKQVMSKIQQLLS